LPAASNKNCPLIGGNASEIGRIGKSASKQHEYWISPLLTKPVFTPIILFFVFVITCTAQTNSSSAGASSNPQQNLPNSPSSSQPAAQAGQQTENDKSSQSPATTSKDRLFYALPNFLTLENGTQVRPMTAGEKFKVDIRSTFDPVNFVWYGFLAGISQAQDSEPGYGQGAAGYGKRYGAAFGDGAIENLFVGAIYPAVLRQDPRFFQSGQGGFVHRLGSAIERVFVTRTDSGHKQFNYSEIFGSATAAAISTYSYHPSDERTLSNTASVWGTQLSYDTLTFGIKEFWPDIRRKLHKNKTDPAQ
jgi:hypothetical protein